MHVLIIPSEEFIPPSNHLEGIFQYHQAVILQKAGYKVGVLSIKQSLTIPMIGKAMILSILRMRVTNSLDGFTFIDLFKILCKKLFLIKSFISLEEKEGISIVRVEGFYYWPPKESRNHFGWIKAGISAFDKYVELYGKPHILVSHNALYAGMLANKLKKKYGIDFGIVEHSSFIARNLISKSLLPTIKKVYNSANFFWVVSPFLGNRLDSIFDNQLQQWQFVPNVLDPYIENANPPVESQDNKFSFVSIGSLIPVKGQIMLIRAFKIAFENDPYFVLRIGGDGELKELLKKEITQLKLEQSVFLLGGLDRRQVLEVIDDAQCLALSSNFETFGVVLIEALSRGKPVLATRCGGPEFIINESNGLLCNPNDQQSIAEGLIKIFKQYRDYNKAEIRRRALYEYGSERFLKCFYEVCNSIKKSNA